MAGKTGRWDVCCEKGVIKNLTVHDPTKCDQDPGTRFLCPSLCSPHIHIDKAFLLSHPKYADLEIEKGDFAEAMKLTSRSLFLLFSGCSSYFSCSSQAKPSQDFHKTIFLSVAGL